ncbi:cytoskeleton-associated protein [Anaeramoeba flamelloides]|uniref:Cytoskeleton-associated protein n=1 Tax=Anaeramoeba flamelloides TaxID=1746091 RepID=A0AAV7Y962_9EUKA|nr:cytoskeleton-associated protein [Anaeramoeba flamelloides]
MERNQKKKLPLLTKLKHRNWKIRLGAYVKLTETFINEPSKDSLTFKKWAPLFPYFLSEKKLQLQEQVIKLIQVFLKRSNYANENVVQIATFLINNFFLSNDKLITSQAIGCLLDCVKASGQKECYKIIHLLIENGLLSSDVTVTIISLQSIYKIISKFGCKKIPIKLVLEKLLIAVSSENQEISKLAHEALVEIILALKKEKSISILQSMTRSEKKILFEIIQDIQQQKPKEKEKKSCKTKLNNKSQNTKQKTNQYYSLNESLGSLFIWDEQRKEWKPSVENCKIILQRGGSQAYETFLLIIDSKTNKTIYDSKIKKSFQPKFNEGNHSFYWFSRKDQSTTIFLINFEKGFDRFKECFNQSLSERLNQKTFQQQRSQKDRERERERERETKKKETTCSNTNVMRLVPNNLYTKLQDPDWKVRRKIMIKLCKALDVPKMDKSSDYDQLIQIIHNLIKNETNLIVAWLAIDVCQKLAHGLEKTFSTFVIFLFDSLIPRLAEQKLNSKVHQTLLQFFKHFSPISKLIPNFQNALFLKTPKIHEEILILLTEIVPKYKKTQIYNFAQELLPILFQNFQIQTNSNQLKYAQIINYFVNIIGNGCINTFLKKLTREQRKLFTFNNENEQDTSDPENKKKKRKRKVSFKLPHIIEIKSENTDNGNINNDNKIKKYSNPKPNPILKESNSMNTNIHQNKKQNKMDHHNYKKEHTSEHNSNRNKMKNEKKIQRQQKPKLLVKEKEKIKIKEKTQIKIYSKMDNTRKKTIKTISKKFDNNLLSKNSKQEQIQKRKSNNYIKDKKLLELKNKLNILKAKSSQNKTMEKNNENEKTEKENINKNDNGIEKKRKKEKIIAEIDLNEKIKKIPINNLTSLPINEQLQIISKISNLINYNIRNQSNIILSANGFDELIYYIRIRINHKNNILVIKIIKLLILILESMKTNFQKYLNSTFPTILKKINEKDPKVNLQLSLLISLFLQIFPFNYFCKSIELFIERANDDGKKIILKLINKNFDQLKFLKSFNINIFSKICYLCLEDLDTNLKISLHQLLLLLVQKFGKKKIINSFKKNYPKNIQKTHLFLQMVNSNNGSPRKRKNYLKKENNDNKKIIKSTRLNNKSKKKRIYQKNRNINNNHNNNNNNNNNNNVNNINNHNNNNSNRISINIQKNKFEQKNKVKSSFNFNENEKLFRYDRKEKFFQDKPNLTNFVSWCKQLTKPIISSKYHNLFFSTLKSQQQQGLIILDRMIQIGSAKIESDLDVYLFILTSFLISSENKIQILKLLKSLFKFLYQRGKKITIYECKIFLPILIEHIDSKKRKSNLDSASDHDSDLLSITNDILIYLVEIYNPSKIFDFFFDSLTNSGNDKCLFLLKIILFLLCNNGFEITNKQMMIQIGNIINEPNVTIQIKQVILDIFSQTFQLINQETFQIINNLSNPAKLFINKRFRQNDKKINNKTPPRTIRNNNGKNKIIRNQTKNNPKRFNDKNYTNYRKLNILQSSLNQRDHSNNQFNFNYNLNNKYFF